MLLAFDPNATREYISLLDREGENPTVFFLGSIDPDLLAAINDGLTSFSVSNSASSDAHVELSVNQRNLELVKFGLKGWKNFGSKDILGKLAEVVFDTQSYPVPKLGPRQGVSKKCMAMVQPLINELAGEIERNITITRAEEKN